MAPWQVLAVQVMSQIGWPVRINPWPGAGSVHSVFGWPSPWCVCLHRWAWSGRRPWGFVVGVPFF